MIENPLDKLHSKLNEREDRRITKDIEADQLADGMDAREVKALTYGREHDMAESQTDPDDAPERVERETDFNSDPEKPPPEDDGDDRQ